MRATAASLLGLAIIAIAPSPALADPYRLHHDYYKLIRAHSAGVAASNGFSWGIIGVALTVVVCAVLLLAALRQTRRPQRTVT